MDSTPLPPSSSSNFPKKSGETAESGKPVKCDLCDVWCQGVVSYQSHLQGRQHYANLVKPTGEVAENGQATKKGKKRPSGQSVEELRCDVCDISCLGKDQYEVHLRGMKHAKKSKMADKEVDLSTMPFIKELDGGKRYECTICNVEVTGKSVVISHIGGVKHQRKAEADPNAPKPVVTAKTKVTTTPTGEPLECKICKLPVNSLFQLEEHKRSLKHKHKEEVYNKWAIQEANIGKDYDAWDPTG